MRDIMGEFRRKTQNYSQAHEHDFRASTPWHLDNILLSLLSDDAADKPDRRISLREPDAWEWLTALAVNRKFDSALLLAFAAVHLGPRRV